MEDYRLDATEAADADDPAALVRRARTGDVAAFDRILEMHQRMVMSTAFGLIGNFHDAQDAAQEAFMRLFQNLRRLDDVRDVKPWLYRVTVNICRDLQRKKSKANLSLDHLSANAGFEKADQAPDPEMMFASAEHRQLLRDGLTSLSAKEREAFVLRDLEGLTTREVAYAMGTREVTVRSQVSAARVKLKKHTERFLRRRP